MILYNIFIILYYNVAAVHIIIYCVVLLLSIRMHASVSIVVLVPHFIIYSEQKPKLKKKSISMTETFFEHSVRRLLLYNALYANSNYTLSCVRTIFK